MGVKSSGINQELCAFVLSHFSRVQLFAAPWTVARQAPLSMGFYRQEYWSRLPFPSPADLSNQGLNTHLLCLLHCRFLTTSATWEAYHKLQSD